MLNPMIEYTAVAIILLLFTIFSYKKKLLNLNGIIFADIVGLMVFFIGNIQSFLALTIFYVVAEAATRIVHNKEEKHEQRTSSNIIGNAGAALIALILGQGIAFFGAIAAALADTISSEIGLLSKNKPVLITTLKNVEKGTNGGVTLLGLFSGLLAAAIIGIVYYLTVQSSLTVAIIIMTAGFIGNLIDSILGATLERKGILNNTQVNFLASSSGAIIAFVLTTII